MKKISRAAIAVLAVVSLTACSTDDSSEAVGTPTPSQTTSAAAPVPTLEETAAPSAQIELPTGMVAGTDQANAHEALMGPIGEYAAAATYQSIIDEFGPVEPYVTILAAEERHISALSRQLVRFGVVVPENPYLGKITAPADLVTAANEEANVEVLNAAMYDTLISQSTDSNLIRVFTNLQSASTDSHKPLFEAAAENGGVLTIDQMMAVQAG